MTAIFDEEETTTADEATEKIREIARAVRRRVIEWNGTSGGQCYEASIALCLLLLGSGYDAEVVGGRARLGRRTLWHAWVRLEDGRIVDVTADQIDPRYGPVLIGAPPARYRDAVRKKDTAPRAVDLAADMARLAYFLGLMDPEVLGCLKTLRMLAGRMEG